APISAPTSAPRAFASTERAGRLPKTLEAPAVEVERDAGDVARPFRAKEHGGVGELLRPTHAAERVFLGGDLARLVLAPDVEFLLHALRVHAPEIGVDPAGTDG